MPKRTKPGYLLHKPTGQARVRIDGRDIYLGEHGSPASWERYNELIGDWLSRNDVDRFTLRIDELALRYLEHAQKHYRKNGKLTSEVHCIRSVLRYVVGLHGQTRVRDFGPKALKDVRQSMIDAGHVRGSININIFRVRAMFKWGVAEEIVPGDVLTALQSVAGLGAGRSDAKESEPVRPVPLAFVEAIEPHVTRPIWGAVQVQLLAGMRPGEVLAMRACDLNMSGDVWEYVPQSHKTQHHKRRRIVFIGPKAQDVLRPFLKPELTGYLFSPRDVREVKPGCIRQPGERYNVHAYRNAIKRACEVAFEMPTELRNIDAALRDVSENRREAERKRLREAAAAWRAEHCWHPHQLRHAAATTIRREADIDSARTVLGHGSIRMADHYAEIDAAKARSIVARIG